MRDATKAGAGTEKRGGGGQDVVVQESRILFSLRCEQVLPLLAAFLVGSALWLVTAYAAGGSLLSLMQFSRPHVRLLPSACPSPLFLAPPSLPLYLSVSATLAPLLPARFSHLRRLWKSYGSTCGSERAVPCRCLCATYPFPLGADVMTHVLPDRGEKQSKIKPVVGAAPIMRG